jgi:hypothetical protein
MNDYGRVLKPIKTEYKGIIFDSKSEAVFARTLDLACTDAYLWNYHPNGPHSKKIHPWDFYIRRPKKEMSMHEWNGDLLIEYKPSMPTRTYVKNLTEKVRAWPFRSILVWGNPWDGPRKDGITPLCSYVAYPIFCLFHGHWGWGDFEPIADWGGDGTELFSHRHPIGEMLGITEAMAQEARQYRFDLR